MNQVIQPAPVRKQLRVRATPEKAFRVFTAGFDRWWPASHHIGQSPMARGVMEPFPGGRWYEIGEDGSECDWGDVLAWEPPGRLLLAWRLNAQWAYDPSLLTEVEVTFTAADDGHTLVEFEHRLLENMGPAGIEARAAVDGPNGWSGILAEFKRVAEDA